MRRKIRVGSAGLFVLMTAGLLFGFQNCSKGFQAADLGSSSGLSFQSGVSLNIDSPMPQTLNLGTETTVPVTIRPGADFSGTVDLSVVAPGLDALDPGKAITFSFDQSSLSVQANQQQTVNLKIKVSTMAPSFALSGFNIVVADHSNPSEQMQVTVPLTVKAIFDVYLYGPKTPGQPSPENWSVAAGSTTQFISHPEGLLVRFSNMDSTTHEVHSGGGPIAHEGGGLAPSADGGKTPGGIYSVTVPAGSTSAASVVYCHDHESSAQGRTMVFNLSPPTKASLNANATYTYVKTNILQPMCVSCHSGATPAGSVDLTTYTNVLGKVKPGDYVSSTLYIVVAPPNPTMPQGASPLSADLVQDLADWIANGAKNN